MIADEIQSGLACTGYPFACDHGGVLPDIYLLGKTLGGGAVPLSAMVADREIFAVLHPGESGSTFDGNPFGPPRSVPPWFPWSSGEKCQARSAKLGAHLHQRLADLIGDGAVALRGLGWWADVDIERALAIGTDMSMRLADRGVLLKDTYGAALRFAPPLVITAQEIDCAVRRFADALWEAGS
ncbi:ornithine aminotransferase rocD2 [Mycobacterium tuberculosis T92]|nr:ornithine aminotransferase rocD2 [Mycobacterium tuberculosis T92]